MIVRFVSSVMGIFMSGWGMQQFEVAKNATNNAATVSWTGFALLALGLVLTIAPWVPVPFQGRGRIRMDLNRYRR